MKLFNVSYMQDNYDGSYLTIGEDTDTAETIEKRELQSTRWADEKVLYSLQVKEVTEIEGYRISILNKDKETRCKETKIDKISKWEGCSKPEIKDAVKDINDNYLSDRRDTDINLVTNKFNVITVEDWNKWYNLFYLTMDSENNPKLVSFSFGDIINGVDHYYYPVTIVEFAKINNLKIDTISYIAICKMYMEDADCMESEIPNYVLPTLEALEDVLIDAQGICTTFYLHHLYDSCAYRNYVKKNS